MRRSVQLLLRRAAQRHATLATRTAPCALSAAAGGPLPISPTLMPMRHGCSGTGSLGATRQTNPDGDDDVVVEPSADTPEAAVAAAAVDVEQTVGEAEEMGFKTETRQLLHIVACSLYTDKEVFIRELVSNASDALEKRRHLELSDESYKRQADDEGPVISITCDQSKSRFVIRDSGIGMTKEELASNLGTIAGSGSKAFVNQLKESETANSSSAAAEKIIGQFGVGFYASFMVSKHVKVYSRSAKEDSKGYLWESDGLGTFKITECENVEKGTKIVLDIKDTELSFCSPQVVERVLKKYSNFVSFEILLNDSKVNTVQALWMKERSEVSEEDHNAFYKFLSGAYDTPMMKLHYSVDAPMTVRALLYSPQSHTEKYGGGRMESGVNLYSRRVLIQSKAKHLLPDWLRFLKGAVDCESIPLNVSREHTQDSSMMRRLSSILTKRIIRWLEEEGKRDKFKYARFVKEYGQFLKEGICTDQVHKSDIAKLLRFETTREPEAVEKPDPAEGEAPAPEPEGSEDVQKLASLDDYMKRMLTEQSHIYYLNAPSREMALMSPYYEQYREHNLEVLICTEPIDDFVMQHLDNYSKHKLQNIELFDAAMDGAVVRQKKLDGDKTKDEAVVEKKLTEAQVKALSDFMAKRLVGQVGVVKATDRLRDSPAVLADHDSAQMRKLFKMTGQFDLPAMKYNLHVNPMHPLVRKLYTLSISSNNDEVETAGLLAEQLFDNAVIAAGLMDDPRSMVKRLNNIMERMVKDVQEPTADK